MDCKKCEWAIKTEEYTLKGEKHIKVFCPWVSGCRKDRKRAR